ncbi:hypothetical protein G6F22_017039 [Rhizopus arrhizus]|nr:hypothetical protein G6F22_017039 [Rhizopus arrhizus]KAG1083252.1 hypothetical protein G6F40_014826 [Rhizopus arrhizus]
MAAGILAVTGFHADDRHDHFGRHASTLLHAIKLGAMLRQERAATIDARLADEHRPVLVPRLDPFGRARHGGDDRLAHLRLVEHAADLLRLQAIALGGIGNEAGPRDLERHRGEIDRWCGGRSGFGRGLGRAMGLAGGLARRTAGLGRRRWGLRLGRAGDQAEGEHAGQSASNHRRRLAGHG